MKLIQSIRKIKPSNRVLIFFLIVLVDQLSKLISINVFNNFILNSGISFGIFSGNSFVIMAIFIALGTIIFISFKSTLNFYTIFLLGGGVSNLIDRIIYGGVVDYINIFNILWVNIADIFINFAVLLIIINIIIEVYFNGRSKKTV